MKNSSKLPEFSTFETYGQVILANRRRSEKLYTQTQAVKYIMAKYNLGKFSAQDAARLTRQVLLSDLPATKFNKDFHLLNLARAEKAPLN